MRELSKAATLALISLATIAACAGRPPSSAPPQSAASGFVVPTNLRNGRVEIVLRRTYPLGANATIPVTIIAARGTIAGPISARILASGINEGGAPSEALVRNLATTTVTATPERSQTTEVSWDGRDEKGALVPADAYSLVLQFSVDDGATRETATATATLEMSAP